MLYLSQRGLEGHCFDIVSLSVCPPTHPFPLQATALISMKGFWNSLAYSYAQNTKYNMQTSSCLATCLDHWRLMWIAYIFIVWSRLWNLILFSIARLQHCHVGSKCHILSSKLIELIALCHFILCMSVLMRHPKRDFNITTNQH